MADGNGAAPEKLEAGVREIERLIGQRQYNEAMLASRGTLEAIVQTLCESADIREGGLIDRIDALESKGVIDREAYERLNRIRMIGGKAIHEKDNSAYDANQVHHLLVQEMAAFANGAYGDVKDLSGSAGDKLKKMAEGRPAPRIFTVKRTNPQENAAEPEKLPGSSAKPEPAEEKAPEEAKKPETEEAKKPEVPEAEKPGESPKQEETPAEAETVSSGEKETRETARPVRTVHAARARSYREERAEREEKRREEEEHEKNARAAVGSRRYRATGRRPDISPSMILKPVLLIAIIIVLLVIIHLIQPADSSDTKETTAVETSAAETGESSEGGETTSAETSAAETTASETTAAETTAAETTAAATTSAETKAAETTAAAAAKYRVRTTVAQIRVRSVPSTDSDDTIVGMLNGGDSVDYVGRQDDRWSIIKFNGKQAYVVTEYLEKAE